MKKNMVYFVLYIVLITELLIVIQERDILVEAEEKIKENLIGSLAESYRADLILLIPSDYSTHNTKKKDPTNIAMIPVGVKSEEEKDSLKYFVELAEDSKKPYGWPDGGISMDNGTDKFKLEKSNGNAVFVSQFNRQGTYKFNAYCKVKRLLPDYLYGNLLEYLKKEIGKTNLNKVSEKVPFTIKAETPGVGKKEVEYQF